MSDKLEIILGILLLAALVVVALWLGIPVGVNP